MEQPRGVQEQIFAVNNLLSGGDEVREDDEAPEVAEEEVPEDAAAGESEQTAEVEDGIEAPEEEAEEHPTSTEEIRTVADFAKAAGWAPEDLYALPVRLDNGEEIPLGQMKDALQVAQRERAEIKEMREGLARQYQELQQVERHMVVGTQKLTQEVQDAHSSVMAVQERFNAIDWEQLAQTDPGRAALLQQQIASEYSGAKMHAAQVEQKHLEVQQQAMQRIVAEENARFLSAVPEWRNPEVAQAEAKELDGFLMQKVGFRPDELQTVVDARMRVVALMALRWYQHQSSVAEVAKKVRVAPKKVVAPGKGVTKPVALRKVDSLVQRAKTSGKRQDQVAAISALLNP